MKTIRPRCPERRVLLIALALAVATPALAEDPPAAEPTGDAASSSSGSSSDDATDSEQPAGREQADEQIQLFGRPTDMDYSAKPVALAAGAALLSRFDFDTLNRADCPNTDPALGTTCIVLKGSTPAPAFVLELSYRDRWSWEERGPGSPRAPWNVEAAKEAEQDAQARLKGAQARVAELKKADSDCTGDTCMTALQDRSRAEIALGAAKRARAQAEANQRAFDEARKEIEGIEKQLEIEQNRAATKQAIEDHAQEIERAERKMDDARARLARARRSHSPTSSKVRELVAEYEAAARDVDRVRNAPPEPVGRVAELRARLERAKEDAAPEYSRYQRYQAARRSWAKREPGVVVTTPNTWNSTWYEALLPEDREIRLGYAFVQSPSGSVFSDVGGSNVYASFGAGWNLLRWTRVSSDPNRVPVRGAFDLEGMMSFASDKGANDVHDRYFIGASFNVGVPIVYRPTGPPESRSTNVIEIVARAGLVVDEVPKFIEPNSFSNNEVYKDNGFVSYGSETGFALEAEFNVPVSRPLGYIFFRGGLVAGIDPNPWFIGIGYTIPIGTLADGLRVERTQPTAADPG
jgi:hypothetical protein